MSLRRVRPENPNVYLTMSTTSCPVFTPSMEEFSDFRSYMSKIQSAASTGICKVVPPRGWFRRSYDIEGMANAVPTLTAIRQVVNGHSGVFDVALFEVHNLTISRLREIARVNCCSEKDPVELERLFWKSLVSTFVSLTFVE